MFINLRFNYGGLFSWIASLLAREAMVKSKSNSIERAMKTILKKSLLRDEYFKERSSKHSQTLRIIRR